MAASMVTLSGPAGGGGGGVDGCIVDIGIVSPPPPPPQATQNVVKLKTHGILIVVRMRLLKFTTESI